MEQSRHQAQAHLGAGLLIEHFRVGATTQPEHRQIIIPAQRGGHSLLVGQNVIAHHRFQVVRATVPARYSDRRARTHQLSQHDAQQSPGVHRSHAAGRGRRRVHSPGIERDVQQWQTLLGQIHALLQRISVGHHTRSHVDIASCEGPLPEVLSPAGHNFTHLHRRHAALKIGRDEDNGLCGVVEHHLHLVTVINALVYVLGQERRHDEVNFRQRVHQCDCFNHILQPGPAPFTGAMVQHVQTIGPAAVVGVIASRTHRHLAVAVVECHTFGGHCQGPGHHVFGDVHPDAIGPSSSLD